MSRLDDDERRPNDKDRETRQSDGAYDMEPGKAVEQSLIDLPMPVPPQAIRLV